MLSMTLAASDDLTLCLFGLVCSSLLEQAQELSNYLLSNQVGTSSHHFHLKGYLLFCLASFAPLDTFSSTSVPPLVRRLQICTLLQAEVLNFKSYLSKTQVLLA